MTIAPAPSSRRAWAANVLASLLLLLAPAGGLAYALLVRDRLPDPLPRHWDLSGEVDGTTSLVAFAAMTLGATALMAVLGLLLVWATKGREVAGFSAPLTGWLVWFLAVLFVGTLHASLDAPSAQDVGLPWIGVVVAFVVSALMALLMVRLVPAVRDPDAGVSPRGSSLTLDEGEKVVWIGGASSTALIVIGGVSALVGAVTLTLVGAAGLVPLLIGLALMWAHRLTARVDDSGVHVAWGPGSWPGTRTPIAEITGVETAVARPGEWGGWGYRMSLKGSAHLVRGGEALVLHRRGRKDLLVTVDGADEARDVLAALLERRDTGT